MRLHGPHPIHFVLLFGLFQMCTLARHHRGSSVAVPVPTRETIALVAREMRAATFEETVEGDAGGGSSGGGGGGSGGSRRVQRKLVTGVQDIDTNANPGVSVDLLEYQGVMGRPGVDFPVLPGIPSTAFSCRSVRAPGYYADLDTDCQVFHICDGGRKISFLCPNGTIFRQSHLICDWWFRVDCGKSVEQYAESAEQLAADQQVYKARAAAITRAMQRGAALTASQELERTAAPSSTVDYLPNGQKRKTSSSSVSSSSFSSAQVQDDSPDSFEQQLNKRRQRPPSTKSYKSSEKERQIPAETASFASGRNSQQYFQHVYYRTTSPSPLSSSGKSYIELDRNRNNIVVPSPSPSSTTQVSRKMPHRGNIKSTASTSSPIFTVKVRPSKNFSYVELHRTNLTTTTDRADKKSGVLQAVEFSPNNNNNVNPTVVSQYKNVNNPSVVSHTNVNPTVVSQYSNVNNPSVVPHNVNNPSVVPHNVNNPSVVPHNVNNPSVVPHNVNNPSVVSHNVNNPSHPVTMISEISGVTVTPNSQSGTSTTTTTTSSSVSGSSNNNLRGSDSAHFVTVSPPFSTASPFFSASSYSPELDQVYFTTAKPAFYDSNIDLFNFNVGQTVNPNPPTVFYNNEVTTPETDVGTQNYFVYNSNAIRGKNLKDKEKLEISPETVNSLQHIADSLSTGNKTNHLSDDAGAKALHSLALYFASSNSDTGSGSSSGSSSLEDKSQQKLNKPSVSEIFLRAHSGSPDAELEIDDRQSTEIIDVDDKELPSVLTKTTKDSYAYLFPEIANKTDDSNSTDVDPSSREGKNQKLKEVDVNVNVENTVKEQKSNDLELEQSRGIVQPMPSATPTVANKQDLHLRDSTDLRELAQVFSRALSAYLEDPDTFRRVLSEVRPTEPTPADGTMPPDESGDEVLDFSDVKSVNNNAYQVPATTPEPEVLTTVSPTQDNFFSISDINNLAHQDNSSPEPSIHLAAPPVSQRFNYFTTPSSSSIANNINNFLGIDNNRSYIESPDYYTHESFDNYFPEFPTAGGVNDPSRPRYGGFHNNSKVESTTAYSPYGAGVPHNLTGQPLTGAPFNGNRLQTQPQPEPTTLYPTLQTSINIHTIPEHLNVVPAYDVNTLLTSNNNNNNNNNVQSSTNTPVPAASSTVKYQVDDFEHNPDHDKLFIASNSQSLVSRDNYLRYLNSKYVDNRVTEGNSLKDAYRTVAPVYSYGEKMVQKPSVKDSVQNNVPVYKSQDNRPVYKTQDSAPIYKSQDTAPVYKSQDSAPVYNSQDAGSLYKSVNLGNGVTLEKTKQEQQEKGSTSKVTWTVSPIIDTPEPIRAVDHSPTHAPIIRSSTSDLLPTTYHPSTSQPFEGIPPRNYQRPSWKWESDALRVENLKQQSSSSTPSYSPTVGSKDQDFFTPTPMPSVGDYSSAASTLVPSMLAIVSNAPNFEKKAEEMFGNLNETAANTLMEIMDKAESNMTIRRLVLLLVADRSGRENKTVQESRSQLIQALLRNPGKKDSGEDNAYRKDVWGSKSGGISSTSSPTTTFSTTTTTTTTQRPSTSWPTRNQNSKSLRGTDAATANRGSIRENFPTEPDSRAVELLKSLYTLAARWG
uniref:Cuticular protein n=1 Tax=Nilaparvata lugens TaxID=108931 RepID=A0A2S1ZS31_NILLU|nr:cuticular protein [Nilaparvata lugens]